MKRIVPLLLVAVLAGGAAFWCTRQFATPASLPPGTELAWLTQEFDLSPAQADRIAALHEAYEPVCAAHCLAIEEANTALTQADSVAARAAAMAHLQTLQVACHDATRAHLQAVAAEMAPAQGKRYLALIGPRVEAHAHTEPFGLR